MFLNLLFMLRCILFQKFFKVSNIHNFFRKIFMNIICKTMFSFIYRKPDILIFELVHPIIHFSFPQGNPPSDSSRAVVIERRSNGVNAKLNSNVSSGFVSVCSIGLAQFCVSEGYSSSTVFRQ